MYEREPSLAEVFVARPCLELNKMKHFRVIFILLLFAYWLFTFKTDHGIRNI
jgi:hypothetical protein